jgi:tRNA(Ile)-lysidine synthase
MAASRKPPSVKAAVPADMANPAGPRITVGLSGGVDSVVLLHLLQEQCHAVSAIHVNHGLSPNAGAWERFCAQLCAQMGVPFKAIRTRVKRGKDGLEAAAREARYFAFRKARPKVLALAHHLDDQAETVLFNLLRGTGLDGASGMAADRREGGIRFLRPLLHVSRRDILHYAKAHGLRWIEDESNADEGFTRNFIRRQVGPLLESRFPRWRENLARAARHFEARGLDEKRLLRAFLHARGLRAPSEAKLLEMLKQLSARNAAVPHDGKVLRRYRGEVALEDDMKPLVFAPRAWKGEARVVLDGGELRFRTVRGKGISRALLKRADWMIRMRSGGERFQPDGKRPRRTLKNLFQEAGVPRWRRERLPMLFCGKDLVWVPGLGIDASFVSVEGAPGILPDWRPFAS